VSRPRRIRQRSLPAVLAAVLLALVLVLAACGSDEEEPAGPGTGSAKAPAAAAAFPATIDHAYGATTIESEPKRIVTVGYTDHETLLALDIKPVGAMDWFGERPYGKWRWEAEKWGTDKPQIVNPGGAEINYEKIAALRPDVIIGSYTDLKKGEYEKLSQIAPTVAQAKSERPYTTPWQDQARTIGEVVGRSADVDAQIKAIEDRFAQIREEHPEFAEQEAVVVDASAAPKQYWAFNSADPRGQFLTAMGFKANAELEKATEAEFGAFISPEKLSLFDVDRLILFADAKPSKVLDGQRVFTQLKVVEEGRDVRLKYYDEPSVGGAMAFSSILSIPFATDGILEALEAQD
jgi:iron complex transport system substrate-binding protein